MALNLLTVGGNGLVYNDQGTDKGLKGTLHDSSTARIIVNQRIVSYAFSDSGQSYFSISPSDTAYTWVPMIVKLTLTDSSYEFLRLGFGNSGPFYYYTWNGQEINISYFRTSGTSTSLYFGSVSNASEISSISVLVWMPLMRPSTLRPDVLICTQDNSKLFTTNTGIIIQRQGWHQEDRQILTSPAAVPLAACKSSGFGYLDYTTSASTDSAGTCYNFNLNTGTINLLSAAATTYRTDYSDIWIVPSFRWGISTTPASYFNPTGACAVGQIEIAGTPIKDQFYTTSQGIISLPDTNSHHIANYAYGYLAILQGAPLGYSPSHGFVKSAADVRITSNDRDGITLDPGYTFNPLVNSICVSDAPTYQYWNVVNSKSSEATATKVISETAHDYVWRCYAACTITIRNNSSEDITTNYTITMQYRGASTKNWAGQITISAGGSTNITKTAAWEWPTTYDPYHEEVSMTARVHNFNDNDSEWYTPAWSEQFSINN